MPLVFSRSPRREVLDLGRTTYDAAQAVQEERLRAVIAGDAPDAFVVAEFDPVVTLGRGAVGRSAEYAHLGIPVREVSRGGKATFHGPGQLVVYPILKLEGEARDLHAYLHALEEALILAMGDFGLAAGRDPRNTGCWVNGRKVASIGVAVRKWVTWHGLALNVATDLEWFRRFDPCGLDPEVMTTMAAELGAAPEWGRVRDVVLERLERGLAGRSD